MNRIFALVVITFKEGVRNRSLLGILFFSLFILGLNIAVAGFFMREIGKVTIDMNLSALSFSGLLLVVFIGINLLAKDIDKKTIHLVLSKPLSRVEYLWGKYLGILFFVLFSLLVLLGFSTLTVFLLKNLYPAYFQPFSWGLFFAACFFIFVKLAVLSAIVIFFTSLTTSSFVTLIFTLSAYIVGETIEEVVFFIKSGLSDQEFSLSLQYAVKGISYLLPNLSAFDFSLEAAHALPVDPSRFLFSFGYACVYIVLLLTLASMVFRRREFN